MYYFIDGLKNYAVFSGRATRMQFRMFVLFYFIFPRPCIWARYDIVSRDDMAVIIYPLTQHWEQTLA